MRSYIPVVVALAWLGACRGQPPQPDQQALQAAHDSIQADSVAMVDSLFSTQAFDTIKWKSKTDLIDRGSTVYRISCSQCHGEGGGGKASFVFRGDTLTTESFLTKDWALAKDPMLLRERIFTGNVAGMPHWGVIGLHYRDIDAAAHYITDFLRVNYGEK
jgi:mono/diheme cytochrome c family protein